MHFSKLFALASLPLLAVAMPGGDRGGSTTTVTVTAQPSSTPASSCSTGDLQCCNTVTGANDPAATTILGLLGIVVQGVDVLVGLTCNPVSVVGINNGAW